MDSFRRKTQLIDAAIKCFANNGYHATQVSDIITEAKVARGTFYLYFKSKHDIFQIILDEFTQHLVNQIKSIKIGMEKSPSAQMRENIERVVDVVFEQPAIARIIFNEAVGLDCEIDKRLGQFYSRLITLIGKSISQGISLGLIRNVCPKVTSCIVLGSFREVITQNIIFKNTEIDRAAIVENLIDVILGGLANGQMLG